MPDQVISVFQLGGAGVNVDLDPLQLADNNFVQANNLISDPLGAEQGLRNRPGLLGFNAISGGAAILGGIGVPGINQNTGTRIWLIGFGPST